MFGTECDPQQRSSLKKGEKMSDEKTWVICELMD
jgi:hypothetical protein